MGFWSRLVGDHHGITANANDPAPPPGTVSEPDWTPGDPDGLVFEGEETFSRSLPGLAASPWSGWPGEWATPNWQQRIDDLVDTAWSCFDLNSSVLASMPVYRLQSGRIVEPLSWMLNPDPSVYNSWDEFAKQLFWDYQLGEAFVLPMGFFANDKPAAMRVISPWLVNAELDGGRRRYSIGGMDVTGEILHIRYRSTTDNARGIGPLDAGRARIVASRLLARYMHQVAETGGVTHEWLEVERQMNRPQTDDLREQYVVSRQKNPGYPAVLTGGATLKQAQPASARDMALLELAQFTEGRIAVMCGVPPFLVGLPSGGDSMTYSNVTSLFDFHDRSSLRPKATAVMKALSGWALARGQAVELNRDEYSRPALLDRAKAYAELAKIPDTITGSEIRTMERLRGEVSAQALTGGDEL
jgi:phage portal protein BeeE